jgi:hypothetical protein
MIFENFGYNLESGEAKILEVIDGQNLRMHIRKQFSNTNLGEFILALNRLTLPAIYRNKTVYTLVDGGKGQQYNTPANGEIILQQPAKFLLLGFRYIGLVRTVNLNSMIEGNNTSNLKKQVNKVDIYFHNTVSCKVGTNLYNMTELFTGPSQELGKPPRIFNGMKTFILRDNPDEEKELYLLKDDYCGCNIQLATLEVDN